MPTLIVIMSHIRLRISFKSSWWMGGWWCLNPILVFSLSLSQAEQKGYTGSVARLESFRALKLTLLGSFRVLKS